MRIDNEIDNGYLQRPSRLVNDASVQPSIAPTSLRSNGHDRVPGWVTTALGGTEHGAMRPLK